MSFCKYCKLQSPYDDECVHCGASLVEVEYNCLSCSAEMTEDDYNLEPLCEVCIAIPDGEWFCRGCDEPTEKDNLDIDGFCSRCDPSDPDNYDNEDDLWV